MKGVIFTEFVEMLEARFSPGLADAALRQGAPSSGGAYTTVGNYDEREFLSVAAAAAQLSGTTESQLHVEFGKALFARLARQYPTMVAPFHDSFSMLSRLDDAVHAQVCKLYPDARTPRFEPRLIDSNTMQLHYRSHRALNDLAHGLILGCIEYFGDAVTVERAATVDSDDCACFVLTKHDR
jgi:hypothetical protein